jgi:hypothetical protein
MILYVLLSDPALCSSTDDTILIPKNFGIKQMIAATCVLPCAIGLWYILPANSAAFECKAGT